MNLTQIWLTWIAGDQFPVADVYRGRYPRVEAAAVAPCAMRRGQRVNIVQQLFAWTLRTIAASQQTQSHKLNKISGQSTQSLCVSALT